MRTGELFETQIEEGRVKVQGDMNGEITGLATDSRDLRRGDLFAAFAGPHGDGHAYLEGAVAAGAAALLVRQGAGEEIAGGSAAVVEAADVRVAFAEAADRFYGHPSGRLDLFGVTGTNGKTSVTHLLESLFRYAGMKAGVVGTIEYRWDGQSEKAPCTTPEAGELQRILKRMADDGVRAVAMEVSSHALAQHRVRGCSFRTGVFTNLGRDHLDFHPDMEDYFSAKTGLFRGQPPETALVNLDDPWGARIAGEIGGVLTYGLTEESDYTARDVRADASGIRFILGGPGLEVELRSSLLGLFNVYNILAASAAAFEYGLSPEDIAGGIVRAETVPGRFEKVSDEGETTVLVDYAHTPDALAHALRAARLLVGNRLILVFGCGGDRDRGKRPLMGGVAARLADVTYLTSDNPRTEDPGEILREIDEGCRSVGGSGGGVRIVPDRRSAIREAVAEAGPGDVVLVAGKGHEETQTLSGGAIPFSDREEARRALREAGK
jgi:UDP-N-acetylmuramoyl-L-alanyl-D-glutamate--2,6-diaminopimelate ligase